MVVSARPFGIVMMFAALCCQPVAAETAHTIMLISDTGISDTLAGRQTWTMSAPRGQPQPDCVETWTFKADGLLAVKSGAETVTKKWRVGDDDGEVALYTQLLSTSGGVDCLGIDNEPSDTPNDVEAGPLWFLVFSSGDTLILCNPQYVIDKKTKKRTPMYGDDACWGELKPAK